MVGLSDGKDREAYLVLLKDTYSAIVSDKQKYDKLYAFHLVQSVMYRIEKQERDLLMQQQRRTSLLIYGLIAICFGLVIAMMFIYSSRKRKVKRRLVEELNEML